MIWLLENELFENLEELKAEIVKAGDEYVTAKYVPFGGGIELDKKDALYRWPAQEIFCYGSLQFIRQVKRQFPQPYYWAWCDLPYFKCSYYYPRFGKSLLNSESCFLPYGQLIEKKDWIFKTFGED